MTSRRAPLAVLGLLLLGSGPCECLEPVNECPPGTHCLAYADFCAQVDQAQSCLQARACGEAAPDVPCEQILRAEPPAAPLCTEVLKRALDAGTVVYHPTVAQNCLDALRSTCGASCARIFEGKLESGELCQLNAECREGLWCDTTRACPGRCARQLGAGEVPVRPEQCRSGAQIALVDGGVRCIDVAQLGAGCGSADDELGLHPCGAGLGCARWPRPADGGTDAGADGGQDAGVDGGSDGGADGGVVLLPFICEPALDAGSLCGVGACAQGLVCLGLPARCTPWAARGEACSAGGGRLPPCQEGLACLRTDGGSDGGATCADLLTPDAGCTEDPLGCALGSRCDLSGHCAAGLAADAGCDVALDLCGPGLRCLERGDAGAACRPPSPAGGACTSARGCATGLDCHDGGCVEPTCPARP